MAILIKHSTKFNLESFKNINGTKNSGIRKIAEEGGIRIDWGRILCLVLKVEKLNEFKFFSEKNIELSIKYS